MLMHAVFAAFIILLIIFVPLLAGSFNPGAILVGFIMGGLFIALPLLDYVPPLERSVGMTMMESRTSMAPKADARQTKAPAPLLQNPLSLIGARPKKAGGLADVKAGKPSKTPNRRR